MVANRQYLERFKGPIFGQNWRDESVSGRKHLLILVLYTHLKSSRFYQQGTISW